MQIIKKSIEILLNNQDLDNVFLASDLHLNHENIIKYCNRPFNNVFDMNKTLVNNWNNIIKNDNVVLFLGDLAFKDPYQWLEKLNGKIYLVKGNHDKRSKLDGYNYITVIYNKMKFLLIHDPDSVSSYFKKWNEWIIHGHHHNNHPDKYPFINKKKKTMNISIELTDYKPISFRKIIEEITK